MAKKLVYQKLIDLTGGRMRLTVSGGGALPMHIEDFLEACGINLIVGWGITETSPIVTGRSYTNNYRGTCGKPIEYVEIEVRHANGEKCEDGEMGICWAKGPNIFKEYYKDKELTNKVKIDDYFDTGDLGVYTKQGEIVLTGRAKETIVLLTGENVEPQPIENKALESNYINQIMLVGQDKPNIGALIILDKDNINQYIEKHKINYDNKMKEIRNLIKSEISHLINAKTGFKSYEFISKIKILSHEFSVENQMLTQSLKIKRNEILAKYKNEISEMYN
jgi:long-chain acyl-CoA synthetase